MLVALIATYVGLNRSENSVRLIKLKGAAIGNISKGNVSFTLGLNKDSISAVPASSQDLLFTSFTDRDPTFFFRPVKGDGDVLNFRVDKFGVFLGNTLISITISNDNGSLEWMKNCSSEELSHLRSVYLLDSLTENSISGIKRIAESASNLGLAFEKEQKILPEIIELIKPVWMYAVSNTTDTNTMNAICATKSLELLIMEADSIDLGRLSQLPKLKSLILSGIDSVSALSLYRLPVTISSLEISDSKIKDLNFLKENSPVKELNIISSDLKDIHSLRNSNKLEVLSLIDCDSIPDLSPLFGLRNLKWFAPPWNINDRDLETIAANSPGIETLVLNDCKYLKSFSALRKLPRLSNLTLIKSSFNPDSLIQFQNLKYLAFNSSAKDDSLKIVQLQSKMPNTLVVPVEPFCMGSGWLVVFFLILVAGSLGNFQFRKMRKNRG